MNAPTPLTNLVAQLVSVRLGSNLPPVATVKQDRDRVARWLDQFPIGNLIVFNGGPSDEVAQTLDLLQRQADVPLLVAMDMENGSGQQISDHATWPHALAFSALANDAVEAVEQFAEFSARQASSAGIHVSCSPVLDIHRNPQNPIIATRAFGTKAERVIELARAYVRGCRAGGLLCCGKHFPGHGNTVADSHEELPIVVDSLDVLSDTDLVPFQQMISDEIDMLMTAHVAFPALDATRTPATLSQPILTALLRQTWGYNGLVVSDSLKMNGIRIAASRLENSSNKNVEANLAIHAIKAGVDLLLDVTDVDSVVTGIAHAAEDDELLQQRIAESFERLRAVKQRVFENKPPNGISDQNQVNNVIANQHARTVANRAIQIIQYDDDLTLPLPPDAHVQAILAHPAGDHGYTQTQQLVQQLASHPQCGSVSIWGAESTAESVKLVDHATSSDTFLVILLTRPNVWSEFGIPPWQHQLIQQLTSRTRTLVASLGIQEVLRHYPQAAVHMTTFSDSVVSQMALVERLLQPVGMA